MATETNKYIALVAALVPADILAIHAIVLSLTTATDDAGTTTITNEVLLGNSFFGLLILAGALFLIARGIKNWGRKDWVLLLIPPSAFVAWAALMGTSALTPLVAGEISRAALVVIATVAAVLIIAVHAKVKVL